MPLYLYSLVMLWVALSVGAVAVTMLNERRRRVRRPLAGAPARRRTHFKAAA